MGQNSSQVINVKKVALKDTEKLASTNNYNAILPNTKQSNKEEHEFSNIKSKITENKILCVNCKKVAVERYKCVICSRIDFCKPCFKENNFIQYHKTSHPMVYINSDNELFGEKLDEVNSNLDHTKIKQKFENVKHEYISCDGCKMDPLIGVRYKCNECENYDLCSSCYEKEVETISHRKAHSTLILAPRPKNPFAVSKEDIDVDEVLNILNNLFLNNNDGMNRRHLNVICKVCERSNFSIDRYKCIICTDYDICGKCFEERRTSISHLIEHPMVRFTDANEIFGQNIESNLNLDLDYVRKLFDGVSHTSVTCDGCKEEPIIGVRFKCDQCPDFDLCFKCYEKKVEVSNHKKNHALVIFKNNVEIKPTDIEFIKELGKGAFGKVYKARYLPKDKIVACKVLEYYPFLSLFGMNADDYLESYLREVNAYNEINSNYVLKMFGNFYEKTESSLKFYLIMEFMEFGSLTNLIKSEPDMTYRCRLQIACNIASGMRRIHEKGFIHRDIRPDNILVTKDYVAKIGDMGIAKIFDKELRKHSAIGFPPYMPKEFRHGNYTQKLDIFTFGLTLYHLFLGEPHVFENKEIRLDKKSPVFQHLIDECLDEDPSKRPSAEYLEKVLRIHYVVLWKAIEQTKNYVFLRKEKKFEIFIAVHDMTCDLLKSIEI